MSGVLSTDWSSGTGSVLLHRESAAVDLSALVPAPRRESRRLAVPDRVLPDQALPDQAGPERDEPLDVRLHAPTPDTVIVRVIGALVPRSCAMLAIRVRQQLHRAPHVILDLSSVTWIDVQVAGELRALHAKAVACGTHLHIAAENERVVEGLRRIDLDEPVVRGTADAVLAGLASGNAIQ